MNLADDFERMMPDLAIRFTARSLMRFAPVVYPKYSTALQNVQRTLVTLYTSPIEREVYYTAQSDDAREREFNAVVSELISQREQRAKLEKEIRIAHLPAPPASRLAGTLHRAIELAAQRVSKKSIDIVTTMIRAELDVLVSFANKDDILASPLWPRGIPPEWEFKDRNQESDQIVIAWDPEALSKDDYKRLIVALGDLVRAHGGAGIKRVDSREIGIVCPEGVGA